MENLGLGFCYNNLVECFTSQQFPEIALEPDLIDPLPYEFPFLEVRYITIIPTPDHIFWPQKNWMKNDQGSGGVFYRS